jgi:putative resolvase
MVMNESEYKDDLAQDMADILTSLCARLYGQRGAANRAKRALQAAAREPSEKEI